MLDLYPVRVVVAANRLGHEAMGTKEKFWCRDEQKARWLFKFARPGTGEGWSEKVAAEVGSALGVSCASVELAVCDERPGSLGLTFVSTPGAALVHGNELLQEMDATYPLVQVRGVTQHTVGAALGALSKVEPPPGDRGPRTAAEMFLGYLLLDALIVNSDRHHENWGVLQFVDGRRQLAPSYDHASSLGRELRDEERSARLVTRDRRYSAEAYVHRARSGFYDASGQGKPLHPSDAFFDGLARHPEASPFWLAKLEGLSESAMETILGRVPAAAITEPGRAFAADVLRTSRRLLLARWSGMTRRT